MPMAGGVAQQGYQCGMLWGAALAAGAQAYRLYGPGPQAEAAAVLASQKTLQAFQAQNRFIDCSDLTGMDWKGSTGRRMAEQVFKFFVKGGPIGCFSMAARYAPLALKEINAAYAAELPETPASPVSCAALLARKAGLSEQQIVMAAGFAGGIGLSGGACGALGAAIWIIGLKAGQQGAQNISYDGPAAQAAVEKFLQASDYCFECTEITGQKFDSVAAHAEYVRSGGCAQIIDSLAAAVSA